jgi:hypothetical protein
MAGNKGLRSANKAKKDEFYTQLSDIEKELRHYKNEFHGKVVFCNCDDPFESNFFKYFAMNFNSLGLKKLIATCYATSPVIGKELDYYVEASGQLTFLPQPNAIPVEERRRPYRVEITEIKDENGDGRTDLADVEYLLKNKKNVMTLLKGNGDFRSDECVELLKQSDVVVTNPPFSLFRDFLALMEEYQTDFLIIGNTNALTYREVFRLFKSDKIRTGYTNFNVGMYFEVPENVEKYHKIENGKKFVRVATSCWFTSLPVTKHKENLILYKHYTPEDYPRFENYDAINVKKYTDIPADYNDVMGVPITFLDKYNPNQFELIGLGISNSGLECGVKPYKPEHKKYRKEVQKRGAVDGDLYMMIDGIVTVPYARILIKRKQEQA